MIWGVGRGGGIWKSEAATYSPTKKWNLKFQTNESDQNLNTMPTNFWETCQIQFPMLPKKTLANVRVARKYNLFTKQMLMEDATAWCRTSWEITLRIKNRMLVTYRYTNKSKHPNLSWLARAWDRLQKTYLDINLERWFPKIYLEKHLEFKCDLRIFTDNSNN